MTDTLAIVLVLLVGGALGALAVLVFQRRGDVTVNVSQTSLTEEMLEECEGDDDEKEFWRNN